MVSLTASVFAFLAGGAYASDTCAGSDTCSEELSLLQGFLRSMDHKDIKGHVDQPQEELWGRYVEHRAQCGGMRHAVEVAD